MTKIGVHTTHCCPIHGCKYSDDDCPIENKQLLPDHSHNNGCERCEDDPLIVGAKQYDISEMLDVIRTLYNLEPDFCDYDRDYCIVHNQTAPCPYTLARKLIE